MCLSSDAEPVRSHFQLGCLTTKSLHFRRFITEHYMGLCSKGYIDLHGMENLCLVNFLRDNGGYNFWRSQFCEAAECRLFGTSIDIFL